MLQQALLTLVHLRKNETFSQLGVGFGISQATAWRYVDETLDVLASWAPALPEASSASASLRLVRSAVEATLDDTNPVLLAAADAALAASGLIDAARLQNSGASPTAVRAARDASSLSLRAAADHITPRSGVQHRPRPAADRALLPP